jgi:hypothetical protein
MKKYIIAIALCFVCFTLSAQQTIYVIDNVTVKNFDGSQLQGKTIKDYQISTQGSGKKAVTVHAITTRPSTVMMSVSPVDESLETPKIIHIGESAKISDGAAEYDVAAPRVFIRSTTTSAEDPIIIIDGKRYEDSSVLKSLDPQQIKSITVLKNEASLKEYDAPNGVIVVELKDPAAE